MVVVLNAGTWKHLPTPTGSLGPSRSSVGSVYALQSEKNLLTSVTQRVSYPPLGFSKWWSCPEGDLSLKNTGRHICLV